MGVRDILRTAARQAMGAGEGATMRSFIGPGAKTFDWQKLITFLRNEADGMDRDTNWMHTSMGRIVPDRDIAQEVSDAGARTNFADLRIPGESAVDLTKPRWTTMGEVYHNPALFSAYTKMPQTLLKIDPPRISLDREGRMTPGAGEYAAFSTDPRQGPQFTISHSLANDAEHPMLSGARLLTHEGNHWAQRAENFPKGANAYEMVDQFERAKMNLREAEFVDEAYRMVREGKAATFDEALDKLHVVGPVRQNIDTFERNYGPLEEWEVARGLKDARESPWLEHPQERYLSSHGETYARIAQQSMSMSDLERAMLPPWERMKMLEWGPREEGQLWVQRVRNYDQPEQIAKRAEIDDEIGRALGDLIRGGVGVGGVTGALALTRRNMKKQERAQRGYA